MADGEPRTEGDTLPPLWYCDTNLGCIFRVHLIHESFVVTTTVTVRMTRARNQDNDPGGVPTPESDARGVCPGPNVETDYARKFGVGSPR